MRKIFLGITGSSGFIGNSFIDKFYNPNYQIFNIARIKNNSQWVFNFDHSIEESVILYASDQSNINICEKEGKEGFSLALSNLESILDKNPARIIYLSSSAVYKNKNPSNNFTEESTVAYGN